MIPTPSRYLPFSSVPKSCGPTSSARPPKPTAIPNSPRKPARSPSFCKRSSAAAQKGEVATRSAAIPLGTHISAQTTAPFPTPSSRRPTTPRLNHSRPMGRRAFRCRLMMKKSRPPAMRKRSPAKSVGCIVSSPTAIAR
jgi:hypothetical protein